MGWSRRALIIALLGPVSLLMAAPIPRATTPAPATQPIEDPLLDRVEALLAARRVETAQEILLPWLKQHPKAPDRDRALFLMADVYFQLGDPVRSFYQLDELLDNYPDSRFFFPALDKQYAIADTFLRGYKLKFLGLRILGAEDEAIEMLYRIQERSPGSALAERALLRTADYYYRTSQFDLAYDAYGAFARIYPRSSEIARVKLRQAFSSLAQFRGIKFDATPLIDARSQFQSIVTNYPALAGEENIQDIIDRINSTLTAKILWSADFYQRTHHLGAATYDYRYLIQLYPNSHEADIARRRLAGMPASVLKALPPPATQPFIDLTPVVPPQVPVPPGAQPTTQPEPR